MKIFFYSKRTATFFACGAPHNLRTSREPAEETDTARASGADGTEKSTPVHGEAVRECSLIAGNN
nr:MAG TPA: hypothetical protein [Inoviridae sp.]